MPTFPRTLAAVLFDKHGTLVDFDLTWGRAGHAVMVELAGGDAAAVGRLAATMHFDIATRRFAATSPLVAGAPDTYAHLWAEASGRNGDAAISTTSTAPSRKRPCGRWRRSATPTPFWCR